MKKLKLFLMLVMLGFGMMVAQNAHAIDGAITSAPCEGTALTGTTLPYADGSNCGFGNIAGKLESWNARIAIAPYAQVTANESYTFIGVSHPSLATAHTSIGVVVEALNMVTVPNTPAGRAAVFTVSAGETHRVFVVNQGHSTINVDNASFTDSQTHLITTSNAAQFGNIKVWGIGTSPTGASLDTSRPGRYADTGGGDAEKSSVRRFDNLAQLSMWGVVYQESNGAGFAMEFVGDMHDSAIHGSTSGEPADGTLLILGNTSGSGRGIN